METVVRGATVAADDLSGGLRPVKVDIVAARRKARRDWWDTSCTSARKMARAHARPGSKSSLNEDQPSRSTFFITALPLPDETHASLPDEDHAHRFIRLDFTRQEALNC
ncbi:unnamed protein product [Jaminaea pallidilutea]